jgi:hypothetical protein
MIRNIYFFLITITSLFSSAQTFNVYPKIVNKDMRLFDKNKICSECKNFIRDEKKCGLFYTIDLVKGKEYERASELRKLNNKCGLDGKYYKKNTLLFVNKLGDMFYNYYPIIVTSFYIILYIIVSIKE